MSTMSKTLLAVLVGILVGGAAYVAAAAGAGAAAAVVAAAQMTRRATTERPASCRDLCSLPRTGSR
jgi:hypothetical protein